MSEDESQNIRLIDKIAMFLIGIINNAPYVIGIASAQRIVKNYNVHSYLGIVLWANTISGPFSRFINNLVISFNIPYEINFIANLVMMLFGLFACAFSKVFWLTCIGIFFIGFSSYLGESVILCFMTYRRKQGLLKSWGSGTGMAGICGAGYSFICDIVEISLFWSFIGVSPVVLVYAALFFEIIWKSPESEYENGKNSEDEKKEMMETNFKSGSSDGPLNVVEDDTESRYDDNDEIKRPNHNNEKSDYSVSSEGNVQERFNDSISDEKEDNSEEEEKISFCDCSYFGNAWGLIFNCGAVYFLEYCIQGVFADCCLPGEEQKKYHYMFTLLNLCYQVGVFISRSSLSCFKFRKIWILTLVQCVFFVFWCFQAFYHFTPFYGLLPIMVCVGLFGGCSYVNAFYLMMNDPTKTTKQKEMITSWNTFFIAIFIVLSTAFTFIAELTFLIPPS